MLGKSIQNATATILLIGGYVVIFSVLISILNQSGILEMLSTIVKPIFRLFHIPTEIVNSFLSGMVELTNGVSLVAKIPLKAVLVNMISCAFLLGFGGFCVLLQVFSIASKANLSMRYYFIGKLLQGCLASLYTAFAFLVFPSIRLDLALIASLLKLV